MKTLNLKTIASIALILFVSINSFAQPAQGKGKGMCANIPNLTDEQQKKIDALTIPHRKEMQTLRAQMKEKQAHLETLTIADNADMTAINKTIDEISVLKTTMMKKREAHKQEIRKILNDEQRLFFDSHAGKHGDGKGMRHGQGMQHQKCQNPKCDGKGPNQQRIDQIEQSK